MSEYYGRYIAVVEYLVLARQRMAGLEKGYFRIDGPKLHELRIERGFSLSALAREARVSPTTLRALERSQGRKTWSRVLRALARVLYVPPDELVYRD